MNAMETLYHDVFGHYPLTPLTDAEMGAEIAERVAMLENGDSAFYDGEWVDSLTDEQLQNWLYSFHPKYSEDGGGIVIYMSYRQRNREADKRNQILVKKGVVWLESVYSEREGHKALIIRQIAVARVTGGYVVAHVSSGRIIAGTDSTHGLSALTLCRIFKREEYLKFDFNTYYASWKAGNSDCYETRFIRDGIASALKYAQEREEKKRIKAQKKTRTRYHNAQSGA